MFHKLKQFNDLRKQANKIKSRLAEETVTMENKAVKIVMDGNQEVKEFSINDDYAGAEHKRDLEGKIKEAMNEVIKKAQRVMAQKMRESGDLNIPGLT